MRWVAFLLIGALAAGCIGAQNPASPNGTAPAGADGTPSEPNPSTPSLALPRDLPFETALETPEVSAFTHAEGMVGLRLVVRMPKTTCDLGTLAHHGIERTDNPDFTFDLLQEDAQGFSERLHRGSVPYPQGHVSSGAADTRPVTAPAYDAAWTAWTTVAGFGDTFTSGSWWRDIDLDAGIYRLEAVNTHGVDGGPGDLTRGGSLLVGLDCAKPFEVLAAGEDAKLAFVSAMGADGETDVSLEMGTLDYHHGSLTRQASGDCGFRTHVNNPEGEISLAGPIERTMLFSVRDDPAFTGEFLRHAFQVPNGVYSLDWDLLSLYNSYWDLQLACHSPLPAGQIVPAWSTPT